MEIRIESPVGPLLTVHPLTPPHTPTHTRKVSTTSAEGERRTSSTFDDLVTGFTNWLSTRPIPPTTHPSQLTHPSQEEELSGTLQVRRSFSAWRVAVYLSVLEELLREHLDQRRVALLRGVFGVWQRRLCVCRGERLLTEAVLSLRRERVCRTVLQAWLHEVRTQRLNKVHRLSALQRYWSRWRGKFGLVVLARRCSRRARIKLISQYFTVWREMVQWSHSEAALGFTKRLHTTLTPDPTVSYPTMVSTLTQVSRNLGLPPQPSHQVHTYLSEELKETTPLNEPLPPVVAMATSFICQLHGCNKAFQHWRQYTRIVRERERAADQLYCGRLMWCVWCVWRCALVRERVSMRGLSDSRKLLLSQVFTAWQSVVMMEHANSLKTF